MALEIVEGPADSSHAVVASAVKPAGARYHHGSVRTDSWSDGATKNPTKAT